MIQNVSKVNQFQVNLTGSSQRTRIEWLAQERTRFGESGGDDETDDEGRLLTEFSTQRPRNDEYAQWIYTIDLSRLEFVIDNKIFFRLDNIPRGPEGSDWIGYIQVDGSGIRCMDPLTPKEYRSPFRQKLDERVVEPALDLYSVLSPRILDPQIWTQTDFSRPVLNDLTLYIFKTAVWENYSIFSTLPVRPLNDVDFAIGAQFLLTLAAPGLLHLTEERADDVVEYNSTMSWIGRLDAYRSIFYKKPRLWFRNCLIVMARSLDDEVQLKGWVVIALEELFKAHRKGSTTTALLWSIQHAVAVVVTDEGVAHSQAIPILDTFMIDDEAFTNGIDFLMHFLKPSLTDLTQPFRGRIPDRGRPSLPFDVVTRILDFTDVKTYNVCRLLTKAVRVNWSRKPRIREFALGKAARDPEERFKYPYPFRVQRRGTFCPEAPVVMYLHHPDNYVPEIEEEIDGQVCESHPGIPFYAQIRKYDRILFKMGVFDEREFISVLFKGKEYASDFLVSTDEIEKCAEKKAQTFAHDLLTNNVTKHPMNIDANIGPSVFWLLPYYRSSSIGVW